MDDIKKYGIIQVFLLIILLNIFAHVYWPMSYGRNVKINGYIDNKFDYVKKAFENNFLKGMEREGANVAVFYKGINVVNLYGGIKNNSNNEEWDHKTKTVIFSTTKAISSVCIALLVDRNYIKYEDKVTKVWPEYGQYGKENTTIEHVLTHMAGIPYLEKEISLEIGSNEEEIARIIENSTPIWPPGYTSGYHGLTFGWIINEIVKRTDPKKRSLHTFFKDEIAIPYNLDIDIGCKKENYHQVAKISQPSIIEIIKDTLIQPLMIPMFGIVFLQPNGSPIVKMQENPSWMKMTLNDIPFNDPKILSIPNGAITGITNSYNLGKLFNLFINGKIVSNRTLSQITEPTLTNWHLERTTLWPVYKGRGFFWDISLVDSSKYIFGHPGYGCQGLHIDLDNELVIVYLSNGLKSSTSILCVPYQNILKATYKSIDL
ncbi:Beta-lactamase-related domain and Beta-lactamase/transpeptidase-like domain-containing protein [Strongyloides ratti]|uniref:Beta-lactamase-related domain and Beta-lactamase/transpeptidase-like domain-containing protein n=1 Tax=Strongyloides ratti TaxID=34506 RepID=A0A090LT39_STRRB|nr:Beta-lactamase-related domain and Beta-lactamase/transpeptidase-like domain-containing protein [Strongyloides ratti]CEF70754.1 Beta-lactamase-related domain and Beta-lactamase/transpeptidase-like domain-containing protein [Strongyloides ratti]